MSELLEPYREQYFISGEINSEVADPDAKMKEIAERYSDGEVSWLDGVSVDYDSWHFNVRPSNTEPLLRLNLEAFDARRRWRRAPRRSCGSSARERGTELERARQALDAGRRGGHPPLRIPTPFAVGRVNTYLIEDDPLTLVDSGPNSGKALDELQHQLAEHGHSIDDIELVVLTHQHIDHLGLVDIIVSHSGAEVAAIDKLVALRRALRARTPRGRRVRLAR